VPAPQLRVARSTNSIDHILRFYCDGLGLDVLGRFENHDGFDGVMLGLPGGSYHLEFTVENGVTSPRAPDEESLLVFYLPDEADHRTAVAAMQVVGYEEVASHNPYWNRHGVTFEDADGYRVVLTNSSWRSQPPSQRHSTPVDSH
jgi:catechol 2,3-dioxygenase-like lactoylglutathione lyase family enzyme